MTHVIGYSPSRFTAIDFSHPLGPYQTNWHSRLPRKLPPYTNLIKTFDKTTWILIGLSISSVVVILVFASFLGSEYGVGSRDLSYICLVPLGKGTVLKANSILLLQRC